MQKQHFNKEYLIEILKKDNAILLDNCTSFNRGIKPKFRCYCGKEENNRTFRDISKKGAYCHDCIYNKADKKRNQTLKDKYDVNCVSQIESVKAKRVATNIQRRGVAVPFQAGEVKEKSKLTCLDKYGVESPLQNPGIMEKVMTTCLERYGVSSALQSETVKEKGLITLKQKYGENITNAFQAEEVKEKIKATNLERRGVEYPGQSEEVKEKIKATNLEKFGVEYSFQAEEVKKKIKDTCLERYGVESPLQNPEIIEKVKATSLERYGVESPLQNPGIMEKVKATNLERYGYEHVLQNPQIMEKQQKNSFKFKDYKMPSGAMRKVQGFEPFALNILVKIYSEEQIKTGTDNVPRIIYEDNGKKRYHYPDISIPHENKLIEVKSTKTFEWQKEEVLMKKKACEEQGFLYEIWCFDPKGNMLEVPV